MLQEITHSIPTMSATTDNNENAMQLEDLPSTPLNLDKVVQEGLRHYKQIMGNLMETKEPFTANQIRTFHVQVKDVILQAFEETCTQIGSLEHFSAQYAEARKNLRDTIESDELMNLHLTKHTNYVEDVLTQIQECTYLVHAFYNEKMSKFNPTESSENVIMLKHAMLKFESVQKFQSLLKKQGLHGEGWCEKELEHELEVNLQKMLLSNKQNETQPKISPEPNNNDINNDAQVQPEIPEPKEEAIKKEIENLPDFSILALPINISIYIDTNSVVVASADATPEIIQRLPARIAFVDDQILIGSRAKERHDSPNYFNIYELIKQQQSTSHFIYLQNFCTTLCTEEVLCLFFKSLEREVLRLKSATTLGNVVLTTAFSCISKEKERLKLSAKMADWKNVRLLSAALTTAIAYSKQTHYFMRKPTQRKLVLLVQYLKDSFTMAVAEIEPNSVSTKVSFGSLNIKECQMPDFLMNHAQMKERGKQELFRNVRDCYWKAGKFIQDFLKGMTIDKILVVKDSPDRTAIDFMLQKLFGLRIEFMQVVDGPVLGASIFASREYQYPYLPKSISVNDCFNTEFVVVHNEDVVDKISTKVGSEERLCCKIDIVGNGSIRVLEKIFDDNFVEVCNFYLDMSNEDGGHEISLFEKIDEDGVYCIRVDIPKYVKGSVTRVDNMLLKLADPMAGSRLDKLTQHYEEINAKSVKKEYYQLYFC